MNSETLLDLIQTWLPLVVFEVRLGPAGAKVEWATKNHERVLGLRADEITLPLFFERVHPEDLPTCIAMLADLQSGALSQANVEIRWHRPDGRWSYLLFAFRVGEEPDPLRRRLQGIVLDTSEVRAVQDQRMQAQRLQLIGQLAGGIAHDFNNLLAVVLMQGRILRDELSEDSDLAAEVDPILDAAHRGASLTRQLLMFARRDLVQNVATDIDDLVEGLVVMLDRLVGEDVDIALELCREGGTILVDPGQFHQVLANLVVNARDAMPDGGTLWIRTRCDPEEVRLEVRDTGCGMDAATLAQAREPFFTTKGPGRGTGLGLSTVHGIVSAAGGRLTLDSRVGVGTAVRIHLPRHSADEGHATRPATARGWGNRNERILLVEDEASLRTATRRVLARSGYEVVEAGSVAEATSHLDVPPDLVICDLILPDGTGRDVHEHFGLVHADVPFVFVTGYTDEETFRRGMDAEDLDLLRKPYSPEQILERVGAALTERRSVLVAS